jgi:hypothetical protein
MEGEICGASIWYLLPGISFNIALNVEIEELVIVSLDLDTDELLDRISSTASEVCVGIAFKQAKMEPAGVARERRKGGFFGVNAAVSVLINVITAREIVAEKIETTKAASS